MSHVANSIWMSDWNQTGTRGKRWETLVDRVGGTSAQVNLVRGSGSRFHALPPDCPEAG